MVRDYLDFYNYQDGLSEYTRQSGRNAKTNHKRLRKQYLRSFFMDRKSNENQMMNGKRFFFHEICMDIRFFHYLCKSICFYATGGSGFSFPQMVHIPQKQDTGDMVF